MGNQDNALDRVVLDAIDTVEQPFVPKSDFKRCRQLQR